MGMVKWLGKQEKKQKERILEGSKEKMTPRSHIVSQEAKLGPMNGILVESCGKLQSKILR